LQYESMNAELVIESGKGVFAWCFGEYVRNLLSCRDVLIEVWGHL
jgi:hypothetical protein